MVMKCKYSHAAVILMFSLLAVTQVALPAAGSNHAARILQLDARGLTIAFIPQRWYVETEDFAGQELTRLDFPGAILAEEEGKPQIPYHVATVAIPWGATVSYRIVAARSEPLANVRIVPFPRHKKIDDEHVDEFVFDGAVYGGSQIFPRELVQISPAATFRDHQIIQVRVAAAQYLPEQRQILKYDRIVLRLDFAGGQVLSGTQQSAHSSAEEELYRGAILNYEQSLDWRKPVTAGRKLSRVSSLQGTTFFRFKIRQEGMYKIDGRFLESNISNLNLTQVDPTRIRLFNNGGRELPRHIDDARPAGLKENAILIVDGGDGRFDRDDFILFYGRGVEGWEFDPDARRFVHYINHYEFDNLYWLTLDGSVDGKRMQIVASAQPGGAITDEYQGLAFVEEERSNPLNSGLNWFGEQFSVTDPVATVNLDLPNAIANRQTDFNFRFAARNSGTHRFALQMNNVGFATATFNGNAPSQGQYINMGIRNFQFDATGLLTPGTNTLQFRYTHNASFGQAFLDWFEMFYPAQLRAVEDELFFYVAPDSGLMTYSVSNFSSQGIHLFDVTNYADVKQFTGATGTNNSITFADFQQPDAPGRYAALPPARYRTLDNFERVEYTDLRNPGMAADSTQFIIIAFDDFMSEARRLESFRENGSPSNRLHSFVAKISDVYNNFSGGLLDPTAIRDFLKYTYDNWSPKPQYVLLLGDGDYDYKNKVNSGDPNWIPTFQSDEIGDAGQSILAELVTRTNDSWFVYLTSDDFPSSANSRPTPIMDMAVGRITARSITEAQIAVDKIIAYESQPLRESWRNTITMVADDELVGGGRASAGDVVHVRDAEKIAENFIPKRFNVQKIYLTEFPKVVSAAVGGVTKPAATEALLRQMNQGTLIVNYIGHGNPSVWAHEAIFEQARDRDKVQNQDKLIFFVASTCDWALFDNPDPIQSMAEELLLFENRGAIAILSSARLVFAAQNARFNQAFYQNLLRSAGPTARIGDALVQTRIQTKSTIYSFNNVNDEKYHIYGDPTLRLAVPQREAVITSMTPDSIVALATVEVAGEVQENGVLVSDFNGTAFINTFDSKPKVRHIHEAGSPSTYFLPGNSIYRGTTAIKNGKFKAKFVVPKDISYGGRRARISAYFWNDETDGSGFRDDIIVSSGSASLADSRGPEIKIYFEGHENFTTGDIIGENAIMIVELADSISGINIAGEIGHRMTLTVDPDEETCLSLLNQFQGISTIDLTELFQFNEGDHLAGKVVFPLRFPAEVEIGGQTVSCVGLDGEQRHTIVVKAWDNSNNSSTAAVEVLVVQEEGLVLREVMNYPNPFRDRTTFTFFANQASEVEIKIYTVSGQLIQTVEYPFARNGFNMIDWDGRDAQGDIPANGVYLYKLIAKSHGVNGAEQQEIIGRLAIIR